MAKRFVSRSNSISVRQLGPKTTRGSPRTNYGSRQPLPTANLKSILLYPPAINPSVSIQDASPNRKTRSKRRRNIFYDCVFNSRKELTNITPETSHIHCESIDRLKANPICTSLRLFCNERRGISTIQNYVRSWAAESLWRYDPLEEFQYVGVFVISGYSSDNQQTDRPFVSFLGGNLWMHPTPRTEILDGDSSPSRWSPTSSPRWLRAVAKLVRHEYSIEYRDTPSSSRCPRGIRRGPVSFTWYNQAIVTSTGARFGPS